MKFFIIPYSKHSYTNTRRAWYVVSHCERSYAPKFWDAILLMDSAPFQIVNPPHIGYCKKGVWAFTYRLRKAPLGCLDGISFALELALTVVENQSNSYVFANGLARFYCWQIQNILNEIKRSYICACIDFVCANRMLFDLVLKFELVQEMLRSFNDIHIILDLCQFVLSINYILYI